MIDYTKLEFDEARRWISKRYKEKGWSWDKLSMAGKDTEKDLNDFLEHMKDDDDWPLMTSLDWKELVEKQKETITAIEEQEKNSGGGHIKNPGEVNKLPIPEDPRSAWQLYRQSLLNNNFSKTAVEHIEQSSFKILRQLNEDTTTNDAVKGLVIGNVQSGKTANMAALMCMAADSGWNMFIVLSGVIENLRKQTQGRLMNDLNTGSHVGWVSLDNPQVGKTSQIIDLSANSKQRYLCVTLKNPTRLRNLITWLQYDSNRQSQMKILIIDDESDQVSIDSSPEEKQLRSTNNFLICNLVNGLNAKGEIVATKYKSMNYVGYTATPYANILNEKERESLYPKNFISTLAVSNQYFGPQQIFGVRSPNVQFNGLNIVRTIEKDEIATIKEIHNEQDEDLPTSFVNSFLWFLIGVSCMRIWNYKKPISMLVHTSQSTKHHKAVSKKIQELFLDVKKHREKYDPLIKNLWEEEKLKFNISQLRKEYPSYDIPDSEINDYPDYELVKKQIDYLLDNGISKIPLEDDGQTLRYHGGVHLCIDNCDRTNDEEGFKVRLTYPDSNLKPYPSPAPAFIVVGGTTLSRGLTIEGIISTFFLRSVKMADTLMQMGRWFGYRRKYEIIPRIWLSDSTKEQFQFLSELDQELRDEIQFMEANHMSPSLYGAKIKYSPKVINLTSKNKQKGATPAKYDFSGAFNQTYLFFEDNQILQHNLNTTISFIESLGASEAVKHINQAHVNKAKIWRNIDFEQIKQYFKNYKFVERSEFFSNMDAFSTWVKDLTDRNIIGNWNVILGSATVSEEKSLDSNIGKIGLVSRSRMKDYNAGTDKIFSIGVLSNPHDLISDIDLTENPNSADAVKKFKSKGAANLRNSAGLGDTPQLVLYFIDKDSEPEDPATRIKPGVGQHIAGMSILMPGQKRDKSDSFATYLSLKMPMDLESTDVEE